MDSITLKMLMKALVLVFLAITFLQAGWDKVVDRAGNLTFLEGHFARSPLKGTVPLLLTALTFCELASGLTCVLAVVSLYFNSSLVGTLALLMCSVTLLMLFFGQRMAKDYAGAASLVGYFLVAILGLGLFIL